MGAFLAFLLERRSRAHELMRQRATDGNLALLALHQMLNRMRQFQREVIATAPQRAGRWMKMKVTFPQEEENKVELDPARLAFLLEHADKNLLPEMLLEADRVRIAVQMINRRSHLMLEKIYPALAAARIGQGQQVDEGELTRIIGPALHAEADQLTESIVSHVNDDVQSLRGTFGKLQAALIDLLPGENFIRVDFNSEADQRSG